MSDKENGLVAKTVMIEEKQNEAIQKMCAERKLRSESQMVRELLDLGLEQYTKKKGR